MSAARLQPLVDAEFQDLGEQRQGDRRAANRRAPRAKLDTMFAATLVNHVIAPETPRAGAYAGPMLSLRAGVVVNVVA